ncbi:hypothetical protein ACP4OV_018878 [Aristida adscensionis]
MPLLHLSLPPHRLLAVAARGRLLRAPAPHHARLSVRAAAAAAAATAAASPTAEAYVLPFPQERAAHHRELAAAAAVVERACRLCVDVKRSLLSDGRSIIEKNDQTPVTVADFGVQALVSLELQRLFPSIPLVAEEDSASLRSSQSDGNSSDVLVEAIFSAVTDKVSNSGSPLTHDDVLRAIDRGGKNAFAFDSSPATYWVLDPIDGTKGFLRGDDDLYVVGLALVVDGELAVGVMGCPNWTNDTIANEKDDSAAEYNGRGILMASHVGCGTWTRHLSADTGQFTTAQDTWKRCFVDTCSVVHMARYCISDGQSWDMIPLSALFSSTMDESDPRDENKILILPVFWGSVKVFSHLKVMLPYTLHRWICIEICAVHKYAREFVSPDQHESQCRFNGSEQWGNITVSLSKYLSVAYGRASVFVLKARSTIKRKSWDHAVGVICVQEAGGQVSDWSGKPLDLEADLTSRRNIYPWGGFLATNGALHDELVEMISANYK